MLILMREKDYYCLNNVAYFANRLKNGRVFFPSPGTTMEYDNGRCKLTFEHVVREEEAVYCCRATNVGGSVSSEACVTVNGMRKVILIYILSHISYAQNEPVRSYPDQEPTRV